MTFEDSKHLGEVVMVSLKPFDWILQEGKCNFDGKLAQFSTEEESEGKAACCSENFRVDCWLKAFADLECYKRIVTRAEHDQVFWEAIALMGQEDARVIAKCLLELSGRQVVEGMNDRRGQVAANAVANLAFGQFRRKKPQGRTRCEFYNPRNFGNRNFGWHKVVEL